METLTEAESSYQMGDSFFAGEHKTYVSLQEKLEQEGYGITEVRELQQYFREMDREIRGKEKAIRKELSLAKSIQQELMETGGHTPIAADDRKNEGQIDREKVRENDREEKKPQGR